MLPSKKKKSILWNFFTEIDQIKAKCNLCGVKLSYKTSTSNLKKHMQIKHPTISLNINEVNLLYIFNYLVSLGK